MTVHVNVYANEGLVLLFLTLLKVVFTAIIGNLIDENAMYVRDVDIFNLNTSFITL